MNATSTFMIYPHVKTAPKNKIKNDYPLFTGSVENTWNIMGGKKEGMRMIHRLPMDYSKWAST